MDDWPGDATFFVWGQPLKIIRKYSAKKGPAPWILFLTPAPRPLQVTVSMLVKLNISDCTLLQGHVFSAKNACFAIWVRVDTFFLNLFPMSDLC